MDRLQYANKIYEQLSLSLSVGLYIMYLIVRYCGYGPYAQLTLLLLPVLAEFIMSVAGLLPTLS